MTQSVGSAAVICVVNVLQAANQGGMAMGCLP